MTQFKFATAVFLGLMCMTLDVHAECTYSDKKYGENSSTKHDDGVVYICKNSAWMYQKTAITVEGAVANCLGSQFYHTQKIKDECDGKSICDINVSEKIQANCNQSNNTSGSLGITYHCSKARSVSTPGSTKTLSAAPGNTIELSCTAYD